MLLLFLSWCLPEKTGVRRASCGHRLPACVSHTVTPSHRHTVTLCDVRNSHSDACQLLLRKPENQRNNTARLEDLKNRTSFLK